MSDPTSTSPLDAPDYARSYRTLMGALLAAPVVIGLALAFVLVPFTYPGVETPGLFAAPPIWVPVLQLAAAAALQAVIWSIGYKVTALDPTTTPQAQRQAAFLAFQTKGVLRFAIADSLVMVSIAAAFTVPQGGFLTYVFGAVLGLVLLGFHIWPAPRNVAPIAEQLDANGARSGLMETFGFETGRL